MSKADDIFVKQFGIVIGLLVLFAILMFFLARVIGAESYASVLAGPSAVAERLAPVGSVRMAGSKEAAEAMELAAAAPPAAPSADGASGKAVYEQACIACHATGVGGAPMLTDKAAWESRYGQGLDALVQSAINGKNAMPARGGNMALSDDEIKSSVEYMLAEAGVDTGSGAQTQPASSDTETKAESQTGQQPVQTAAAATQPAAEASGGESADGQPGDEVYKTACIACHATGAANAPKVGDQAAWTSRVGQGLAALVHAAVNGKNAMPPKGGMLNLTDGDVRNAVVYMLEESGVSAE